VAEDPRVTSLRTVLADWVPVDEREASSLALLRELLATRLDDVFSEEGDPHHVTASSFVMSARGVILHKHRKLGIWVQPGGHVDAGEDPADAALRETLEETGLPARHPATGPRLVHVDVHEGPRGHTHYDLRYLLDSDPVDPSPPEGESPDVYWFDHDTAQRQAEPALRPILARLLGN